MEEAKTPTLTPAMIEGCLICSVQILQGNPPMLVMELEDRCEQRATLQVIAGAIPILNGNLLTINPSITINFIKKEGKE